MRFSMLCLLLFLATATPLSLADQDPNRLPANPTSKLRSSGRALNTCECARATGSDQDDWYVSGKEVSPTFQVMVYTERHWCTGTIINRRYVLTAAHCLYNKKKTFFNEKFPWYVPDGTWTDAWDLKVVAGEPNLCDGSWDNEGGQKISVIRTYRHPEHKFANSKDPLPHNDIAILELKTDIKFGDHVKPACLPTNPDDDFDGMTAIESDFGGMHGCRLKRTSLTILGRGNQNCTDWTKRSEPDETKHDDTTWMCAFGKDAEACTIDNGGPLVVEKDHKYMLVGVTSYGGGCNWTPDHPSIYARVTDYLDWIADITKDGNC